MNFEILKPEVRFKVTIFSFRKHIFWQIQIYNLNFETGSSLKIHDSHILNMYLKRQERKKEVLRIT